MFPGLVRRSKLSPTREAGGAPPRLYSVATAQPIFRMYEATTHTAVQVSLSRSLFAPSILSPLQRRALRWKKAYVLSLPYAAYQHSAPCSKMRPTRSRRHLALTAGGPRGNGGWSQYLWIIFKSSRRNDPEWVLCILDLGICIVYD